MCDLFCCNLLNHLGIEAVDHSRSSEKHPTKSRVFPSLLPAVKLPACFTTKQSIVEASWLVNYHGNCMS